MRDGGMRGPWSLARRPTLCRWGGWGRADPLFRCVSVAKRFFCYVEMDPFLDPAVNGSYVVITRSALRSNGPKCRPPPKPRWPP